MWGWKNNSIIFVKGLVFSLKRCYTSNMNCQTPSIAYLFGTSLADSSYVKTLPRARGFARSKAKALPGTTIFVFANEKRIAAFTYNEGGKKTWSNWR
jgi:hypothetical protein